MEANIAALSKHQIANFFTKHAPTTQEECHRKAALLAGGPVHPAPVQGATSYTVVSDDGSLVVQFRAGPDALDLDLLGHVELAYRPFAPHHQHVGMLGTLHIYAMNNVGGVSVYLAMDQLHGDACSLLR
ncbi:hypothetical protein IMZ48_23270 [Candidatus Bathyarchaeota archaeon]|nr:hypothetical protein [Candidatus Bathyarchaeota archaeon]